MSEAKGIALLIFCIPIVALLAFTVWYIIPFIPMLANVGAVLAAIGLYGLGHHWYQSKKLYRRKLAAEARALETEADYKRAEIQRLNQQPTLSQQELQRQIWAALSVIEAGGSFEQVAGGFRATVVHGPRTQTIEAVATRPALPPADVIAIPSAPPFHAIEHLITADRIPLTYVADGPVFGDVSDLLSMALVGKPKRGKTTALLYYVCILLLIGAEVCVWDPHGEMSVLAGLNYYDRLDDIAASVPLLLSELDARDELYRRTKAQTGIGQVKRPLVLLIDEVPVIADWEREKIKEHSRLKISPPASPYKVMRRFTLEARKWNGYVFISGQSLPAQVLPTLTRDNLSSRLVLECSADHARMIGLPKEAIDTLLPLLKGAERGTHIADFSSWSRPELADIPYTTSDDLRRVIEATGNSVSASETATQASAANVFPFPSRETPPSVESLPVVGNDTRETIRRMKKKGMVDREISLLVGLSGRKYYIYRQVCGQLGLASEEEEAL